MIVTSIIRQDKKMAKVYIDNSFGFSADYEDIKRLYIEEGRVIDNSELSILIYECQYNKALSLAIRQLSMRSRTEQELRKKLEQQDYDKMIIEQVITRTKELGYVNDAEFTKIWVEERKRVRPSGKKKLVMGLCSKGIDSKLANEVVGDCNIDDFETAIQILDKKFRAKEHSISNSSEYRKIYRHLIYRGIEYNAASKAIKMYFNDSINEYFD